jgi:hypothetical protein
MSYAPHVATRPTTDTQNALMQGHPRGRGFRILSRLARGQGAPAATAAPQIAPEPAHDVAPRADPAELTAPQVAPQQDEEEWTAPVIAFDRTQPTPRHRRDGAADESADFDVSVVPVARRSS